jgi:NAD(P) transhydrogenase
LICLCIGSGPAGQRAAVQASKLGKRAVVVEKCCTVGGVSLNAGTIPSKTFREAVIKLSSNSHDMSMSPAMSRRPSASQLFAGVKKCLASRIRNRVGSTFAE